MDFFRACPQYWLILLTIICRSASTSPAGRFCLKGCFFWVLGFFVMLGFFLDVVIGVGLYSVGGDEFLAGAGTYSSTWVLFGISSAVSFGTSEVFIWLMLVNEVFSVRVSFCSSSSDIARSLAISEAGERGLFVKDISTVFLGGVDFVDSLEESLEESELELLVLLEREVGLALLERMICFFGGVVFFCGVGEVVGVVWIFVVIFLSGGFLFLIVI